MAHFMDYGEQVSRKALAELPRGPLRARRGTGRRRDPQGDDRHHRRRVHRRPPRQPRPGAGASQCQPRRRHHLRADGLQGADRARGAGKRRLVPPAESADAARLDLRRQGAGGARFLFRGRGAGLRPHAPLPRAAYAGPSARRQFRLDLRHGDRRPASRHRPAFHHRRAAGRRLGRQSAAATATRRSSRAFTARPSTARPRSRSRATGSTSTRRRSTRRAAARAAGVGGKASASTIASAPTAPG